MLLSYLFILLIRGNQQREREREEPGGGGGDKLKVLSLEKWRKELTRQRCLAKVTIGIT